MFWNTASFKLELQLLSMLGSAKQMDQCPLPVYGVYHNSNHLLLKPENPNGNSTLNIIDIFDGYTVVANSPNCRFIHICAVNDFVIIHPSYLHP